MSQVRITLDDERVGLLAGAASVLSREDARKEAIEQDGAYDQWFRAKVEEGLKDLAEGRVVSHEAVEAEAEALITSIRARVSVNK